MLARSRICLHHALPNFDFNASTLKFVDKILWRGLTDKSGCAARKRYDCSILRYNGVE